MFSTVTCPVRLDTADLGFRAQIKVSLFSLATGHLVKFVISSWKVHEGEVLLADRAFSNWGLISLFQRKGFDLVKRGTYGSEPGTARHAA